MPWKMKKVGETEVHDADSDGNPIWIDGANKEAGIKGDTITRLNGEAANHRKKVDELTASLSAFDGIDATKAREALDTVSKIKQGDLINAGKVDEVRLQVGAEFQAKLDAKDAELTKVRNAADNDKLTAAFASSGFVRDRLNLGPDLIQTMFANKFAVKDGKVVGLDANGQAIISSKNMGEVAGFDEVMESLVGSHASKDALLKGANNSGTGGNNNGGGNGAQRTVTREQERAMNGVDRAAFMQQVNEGKAQLVD